MATKKLYLITFSYFHDWAVVTDTFILLRKVLRMNAVNFQVLEKVQEDFYIRGYILLQRLL